MELAFHLHREAGHHEELPSYAFVHNAFAAETEGFWPYLGIVVPFALNDVLSLVEIRAKK
jgi:hypothetical protein